MQKFLSDLYQPVAQFASQFDSPQEEGLKSLARLLLMMGISWIIIQILGQIDLVPDAHKIKVWVFMFNIPLRSTLWLILTSVQKYLDKLLYELNSNKRKIMGDVSTGLMPF